MVARGYACMSLWCAGTSYARYRVVCGCIAGVDG